MVLSYSVSLMSTEITTRAKESFSVITHQCMMIARHVPRSSQRCGQDDRMSEHSTAGTWRAGGSGAGQHETDRNGRQLQSWYNCYQTGLSWATTIEPQQKQQFTIDPNGHLSIYLFIYPTSTLLSPNEWYRNNPGCAVVCVCMYVWFSCISM